MTEPANALQSALAAVARAARDELGVAEFEKICKSWTSPCDATGRLKDGTTGPSSGATYSTTFGDCHVDDGRASGEYPTCATLRLLPSTRIGCPFWSATCEPETEGWESATRRGGNGRRRGGRRS